MADARRTFSGAGTAKSCGPMFCGKGFLRECHFGFDNAVGTTMMQASEHEAMLMEVGVYGNILGLD